MRQWPDPLGHHLPQRPSLLKREENHLLDGIREVSKAFRKFLASFVSPPGSVWLPKADCLRNSYALWLDNLLWRIKSKEGIQKPEEGGTNLRSAVTGNGEISPTFKENEIIKMVYARLRSWLLIYKNTCTFPYCENAISLIGVYSARPCLW